MSSRMIDNEKERLSIAKKVSDWLEDYAQRWQDKNKDNFPDLNDEALKDKAAVSARKYLAKKAGLPSEDLLSFILKGESYVYAYDYHAVETAVQQHPVKEPETVVMPASTLITKTTAPIATLNGEMPAEQTKEPARPSMAEKVRKRHISAARNTAQTLPMPPHKQRMPTRSIDQESDHFADRLKVKGQKKIPWEVTGLSTDKVSQDYKEACKIKNMVVELFTGNRRHVPIRPNSPDYALFDALDYPLNQIKDKFDRVLRPTTMTSVTINALSQLAKEIKKLEVIKFTPPENAALMQEYIKITNFYNSLLDNYSQKKINKIQKEIRKTEGRGNEDVSGSVAIG